MGLRASLVTMVSDAADIEMLSSYPGRDFLSLAVHQTQDYPSGYSGPPLLC